MKILTSFLGERIKAVTTWGSLHILDIPSVMHVQYVPDESD